MFEGLVAKILNKYLSEYIDAVDYNNVKIGLNLFTVSGSFELKNVNIKPSAMYQFDLPIEIKYGKIGKLKIHIPIKNLNQEPAKIEIEDVFILLVPFEKNIFDSKRVEELINAHKRKQLAEMDKLDQAKIPSQEKSYADQIQDTIVNNIIIEINNVHIRYEDKYSIEKQLEDRKTKVNIPISCGIYLKRFLAQTVDTSQNAYFAKADDTIIYKNGRLEGFNSYWNCNYHNPGSLIIQQEEFKSNKDKDYCMKLLKNSIQSGELFKLKFEKFLKKNLDLNATLKLRRTYQECKEPKITFKSSIESIVFEFKPFQYKSLVKLIDCYSMLNENKLHVKYRPKETLMCVAKFKKSFKSSEDSKKESNRIAKLWWQYLMTGTCEKRWRSYRRDRISAHWKIFKDYIEKYKIKLLKEIKNEKITEQEIKQLEQLELKLNLESIFDARNYVREKLKMNLINDDNPFNDKAIDKIPDARSINYVEICFKLDFPSIKLKLFIENHEILSVNFIQIFAQFETRPVANNFFFKIDTKDIEVKGVFYKKSLDDDNKEMVTLVSSKNTSDNFILFSYENNPIDIENVEFNIKTRVTSLEIFYEKTSITEIIRFFSDDTDNFSTNEYTKLSEKLNAWSTAGVLFALDNHKQFHIDAKLSSPYFIIPVTGTRKEPGNTVVFFLGETTIQSELQKKRSNSATTSIKDLEENFYDKLRLIVNDIQVMLIPTNENLKDYLRSLKLYDYKYHFLYPVTTQNTLYLSINPKFKKLPKVKIDAKCPSVRLNFSDNKIIKLIDFMQKLSFPQFVSKPGHTSSQSSSIIQRPSVYGEQINLSNKLLVEPQTNSIAPFSKQNQISKNTTQEPDDEWEGPFFMPTDMNSDPITNYAHVLFTFSMNDFCIDLKGTDDHLSASPLEHEYLNFVFSNIKLSFAITKHGFHLKSSLGTMKLIDKKHHINQFEYTEVLSSRSNNDLIELKLRQVDSKASNFATLYHNTLFSILLQFRSIQLVAHRTGIVYFFQYAKQVVDNINFTASALDSEVKEAKHESAVVISKPHTEYNICDFNIIANMSELKWKMYDDNCNFGSMEIKNLQVIYKLTGITTDLKVRLETIFVNYENNDTALYEPYKKIISCTAGEQNRANFFDFKLVFYDTSKLNKQDKTKKYDDKIFLTIGQIKVICLVKFVNELISFIEPIITFIEPVSNLAVQISDITGQAVNMAVNMYQETQTEESTKKILLNIEVSSPLVVIPRNSKSKSAFYVELGNLKITNKFLEEYTLNSKNLIDEIELKLSDVKIKRIKYLEDREENQVNVIEKIISPINMITIVRRTVATSDWSNVAKLKIIVEITSLDSCISVKSAQLLFLILDENLTESIQEQTKSTPSAYDRSASDQLDKRSSKVVLEIKKGNTVGKEMEICVELNEIKLKIVDIISITENNINKKETSDFSLLLVNRVEFFFFKYDCIKWDALFKMKALSLKDLRADSNLAVKEMFVPLNTNEYFIDLTYSNRTEKDSFLGFNINYLRINLCLPYVLKLYQMAIEVISPPSKQQSSASETSKKKSNKTEQFGHNSSTNTQATKKKENLTLKANAKINLPEIILFAEPENPNTMILFMNVILELKFKSNKDGLDLEIRMNELGIRLGEFKKVERRGIPFLTPCSAILNMNQKQGEKIAYYYAIIPSLYFNMTPTLYKVVMGVINTINKTGTEKTEIEQQTKTLNIEASEPFKKQRLESKNLFSRTQNDLDLEDDNSNSSSTHDDENEKNTENKIKELLEALDLKVLKAFIIFCEETGPDLQPLAVVKLNLNGRISNWTKNMHFKSDLCLEASYYNDRLSNWEPLIENVMEQEDKYRPWKLHLWFAIHPSRTLQPPSSIENKKKPDENNAFPVNDLDYSPLYKIYKDRLKLPLYEQTETNQIIESQITPIQLESKVSARNKNNVTSASYMFIKSEDILNINVTPSAYKVIIYLAKIASGTDKDKILENKSKSQIKFLNFLNEKSTLYVSRDTMLREEDANGFTIKFQHSSVESTNSLINSNEVRTSLKRESNELTERISKIVENSQRSQIDAVYDEKYKFVLKIDGFSDCQLSLKTDGSYLIGLTEEVTNETESIKYNLMYKIRTNYGRTKVLFSSPLQIENNTQIKLLILVEMTDKIRENRSKHNITQTYTVSNNLFDNSHLKADDIRETREFGIIFELNPSKVYYVPLYFAYKCKLFIAPKNMKYAPALIFDIRGYNFRKDVTSNIVCKRMDRIQTDLDAEFEMNDFQLMKILTENSSSHRNIMMVMHANYRVVLFSSIKLYNCLPFDVRAQIYGKEINKIRSVECTTELKPGENFHLNIDTKKLDKFNLHVNGYLNGAWDYDLDWLKIINDSQNEIHRLEFQIVPDERIIKSASNLNVYMYFKKPNEYSLYSPYWLVNKSGLSIHIKALTDDKVHELADDRIVLFDFKNLKKKNYVRMKLSNSTKWSSKFSLDAVGTTGITDCKDNNSKVYTFLIRSAMSNTSRSKLITFAPFLSIVNQLEEDVEITEHLNDRILNEWQLMPRNTVIAYWLNFRESPFSGPPCFVLKLNDAVSEPFPLQNPSRYVLLFNKNSPNQMIRTVLISGGSTSPVSIIVRKYNYGDSVAKLINHCDKMSVRIKYDEKDEGKDFTLSPSEFTYFVWPYPKESKREVFWTVNASQDYKSLDLVNSSQNKYKFTVTADECASTEDSLNDHISHESDTKNLINNNISCMPMSSSKNQHNVHISCVSYMDGTQRVVLFTTDHSMADVERKKEAASMEIFTYLKGVQMSVINNVNLEIATISINSNKTSWLLESSNEIRAFSDDYSIWIEEKYLDFIHQNIDKLSLRSLTFDFKNMQLNGSISGKLKRFSPHGLSIQYRTSTSMMSLKCSIQKLQIDNQLPDAYFPICFFKAPSLLSEINPGPLITFDLFTEQQEVTQIYRYFKCNLKEFFLKADKGFLYSLWDWYDAAVTTSTVSDKMYNSRSLDEKIEPEKILVIIDEEEKLAESIKLDKNLIKDIMEYTTYTGNVKQSSLIRFDDCSISTIACNLSFSVNGKAHTDDKQMERTGSDSILDFFLESIGSTITEFKDVKFYFRSYDIKNQLRTWDDLFEDFFNHFKLQGLHQTYALILGLDVLGNPFGLVTNVSHNLTDLFYDPLLGYFGSRNKNDTNTEKVNIELKIGSKIKDTVNKTISNLAGSGSLITGSFGRVLATCSFDKEYKRRRQYKLSRSSTWKLSESLKVATKGIAVGTLEGITGVFEKPFEEKSLAGFSKGVAGLFAKPFGSVFDGISITLDGLKRFAHSGSESIIGIRLPRHLISNVAILPYSEYLAKGFEILRDLQNDNIAEADEAYWSHMFYEKGKSTQLVFVTNANLYKLRKTNFDIRTKWKRIEKPISIFKIKNTKIEEANQIEQINLKSKLRNRKNAHINERIKEQEIEYDLIIYVDDRNSTQEDKSKQTIKFITSNLNEIKWLSDKINSIVKYCDETRKIKI